MKNARKLIDELVEDADNFPHPLRFPSATQRNKDRLAKLKARRPDLSGSKDVELPPVSENMDPELRRVLRDILPILDSPGVAAEFPHAAVYGNMIRRMMSSPRLPRADVTVS